MQSVKLKVSLKDWLYIVIIGSFFGFFISLLFYFLNDKLRDVSTVIFSVCTAVIISIFSSVLITLSNNIILPKFEERFWYIISFIFSFCAGFFGSIFSFLLFSLSGFNIVNYLLDYWFYLSIITGFLTFLIGLILHQFISMKHKNEVVRTEYLESKLKALENELNPHFLFNALNSISELIYIDQRGAERATINVSKFLRNVISKDSLIDLKTEISMIKTYVDIENIRFNDNIVLNIDIQEDVIDTLKVPKFSLQLLVENAIKHGYMNKTLNIDIIINERYISVENNGKFIDEINYGTGLSNLSKRLKLQNIGELGYEINDKLKFIIQLNKENK